MSEATPQPLPSRAEPPRYQPLVVVLAAACLGIVMDRRADWSLGVWWTAALGAGVFWLMAWRGQHHRTAAVALLVAVAACAAAWHHCRWSLYADDDLGRFTAVEPQPVCADAVALKVPVRLPASDFDSMRIIPEGDRTRLEVRVIRLRDGSRWRQASGRATLMVDGHLLGVRAGDRLRIFAELAAPRSPQNPGEIDRSAYSRASRIRGILRSAYPDCVTVVDRPAVGGPARWIGSLRSEGERLLREHIHPRRAPLAGALLLGVREEIGEEREDAYLETGTVHLLSISGFHVGILAGAMLLAFRLAMAPRGVTAISVAGLIAIYAMLTDAEPPAVRATVLVAVMCLGYGLQRRGLPFNSLAAAALVVLAVNPAELFRIGAQLSFLSVAGLMWFAPHWASRTEQDPLERLVAESRSWPSRAAHASLRWLRDLTRVSATIWLLTLPLVAATFHIVAPVALVLNTIVWVPVAVGMVSGFLVLATGWLLPPLAAIFGWICDGSLVLTEACVALARQTPYGHFWIPGPAGWWLMGLYGGLGLLAAVPALRPPRRWLVAILAGWTAAGFIVSLVPKAQPALDCTFLSVGHGCAVVIRAPSGQTILYDAGQMASPELGARSIAECLWSFGVTHLDAVVLSHSDADHYNSLPELLRLCSVGVVYVSPMMFEEPNTSLETLRRRIRDQEVPIREISAGDRLAVGRDWRMEVIHPTRRGVIGSDNANSVVLAIEHLGRRILLPGDIEPPGLDDLIAELPWDCDVLLAPHHGSRGSDPPGLAAWCRPEWVIVSGSRSKDWEATAIAYRAGGAKLVHTAECGAVHVTIDPRGIHVIPFRRHVP